MARPLVGDERLQLRPVRLGQLATEHRVPVGHGHRDVQRAGAPPNLAVVIAGLDEVAARLGGVARERLATLPTPFERGPHLPGGARLWVKRDDLTGLGVGGNKARKLEFLCGAGAPGRRPLTGDRRRRASPTTAA